MIQTAVKLADYLFERLRQLGVVGIHGVPGDYNLQLLDHIEPRGLQWIGNCNELNAGYAADGYARVKGVAALITTFGVGELSAINAIAGAFAELAPVVHIVGSPARKDQEQRSLIHHTLNDGDYHHFSRMYEHVTVAQTILLDPRTAAQQIDSTLQQCLLHSRPVYIQLPIDMVDACVDGKSLSTTIEFPLVGSSTQEALALETVIKRMYSAKQPMILVDGEIKPYNVVEEVDAFIRKTNWPIWTTCFGKSLVDETLPNYRDIWRGNFSTREDTDYIDSADLILCFGPHFSDTNTYSYTTIPNPEKTIYFKSTIIETSPKQKYQDVPLQPFLTKLLDRLDRDKLQTNTQGLLTHTTIKDPPPHPHPKDPITQDRFYKILEPYLRPGDILLAETGTAGHGCRDIRLPRDTLLLNPVTWLSIGYMLPAAQGAALAQREMWMDGRWKGVTCEELPRTILLIGDGSLQMTVQEISTIIRLELNVLIIVINNDGYMIERCIHGWDQDYNGIARWKYTAAAELFGGLEKGGESGYRSTSAKVSTWEELHAALGKEDRTRPAFRMIEVVMDKDDAPASLMVRLRVQKDAVTERCKEA